MEVGGLPPWVQGRARFAPRAGVGREALHAAPFPAQRATGLGWVGVEAGHAGKQQEPTLHTPPPPACIGEGLLAWSCAWALPREASQLPLAPPWSQAAASFTPPGSLHRKATGSPFVELAKEVPGQWQAPIPRAEAAPPFLTPTHHTAKENIFGPGLPWGFPSFTRGFLYQAQRGVCVCALNWGTLESNPTDLSPCGTKGMRNHG